MALSINAGRILDTIDMVEKYRLDIRTVTMGISLLGCIRSTMEDTAPPFMTRSPHRLVASSRCARASRRSWGCPSSTSASR